MKSATGFSSRFLGLLSSHARGERRQSSVATAMQHIRSGHDNRLRSLDAVRPFVSVEEIRSCRIEEARESSAAVLAIPIVTILSGRSGRRPYGDTRSHETNAALAPDTPGLPSSHQKRRTMQEGRHYGTDEASLVEAWINPFIIRGPNATSDHPADDLTLARFYLQQEQLRGGSASA